jgi:hypothetical protein
VKHAITAQPNARGSGEDELANERIKHGIAIPMKHMPTSQIARFAKIRRPLTKPLSNGNDGDTLDECS